MAALFIHNLISVIKDVRFNALINPSTFIQMECFALLSSYRWAAGPCSQQVADISPYAVDLGHHILAGMSAPAKPEGGRGGKKGLMAGRFYLCPVLVRWLSHFWT